jgi:hypothetical protein
VRKSAVRPVKTVMADQTARARLRIRVRELSVGPNIPTSFKSDSTKNYELGLKSRWLDSRLTANLALYAYAGNDRKGVGMTVGMTH